MRPSLYFKTKHNRYRNGVTPHLKPCNLVPLLQTVDNLPKAVYSEDQLILVQTSCCPSDEKMMPFRCLYFHSQSLTRMCL